MTAISPRRPKLWTQLRRRYDARRTIHRRAPWRGFTLSAIEKYVERNYDRDEVESGWHGWRATLTPEDIHLPSESELHVTRSDDDLNSSGARKTHCIEELGKRQPGPMVR